MTFVRIWSFAPARNRAEEFVAAYGPTGDWARLFRLGEGYLGTELLHPAGPGGRYLTIDRWRSEADWRRFLERHGPAYRALDARLDGLCTRETAIGDYLLP